MSFDFGSNLGNLFTPGGSMGWQSAPSGFTLAGTGANTGGGSGLFNSFLNSGGFGLFGGGGGNSGGGGGQQSGGNNFGKIGAGVGTVIGGALGGPLGAAAGSAILGGIGGLFGGKAADNRQEAAEKAREKAREDLAFQTNLILGADMANTAFDFGLQNLAARRKYDMLANDPNYLEAKQRQTGAELAGLYGPDNTAAAARAAQMFYG